MPSEHASDRATAPGLKIIWINRWLEMMYRIVIHLFCTHLTFDLILRLWSISTLGIHPYGCWHTSRNTISMDAEFYSILPSKVKINLFLFKWTANYHCKCQNKTPNLKIRFSASVRMSKQDFEGQNTIFGLSANVKVGKLFARGWNSYH